MFKIRLVIGICLCLSFMDGFSQSLKGPKDIEQLIDGVIDRAYNSSVKVALLDTVTNREISGVFSGVVVTEEGHVLTAAHATKINSTYKITFPNGDEHIAKSLGRISIGRMSQGKDVASLDLSMLKITRKARWSFVEMAESTKMKVGELCVGISYPATFSKQRPSVRLGRLTKTTFDGGFFVSTCKMEPGDSGGALFDATGKLIGIHSWINNDEEANYEIPVDLFKKYWSALNISKDYKVLPDSTQLIPSTTPSKAVTIPPIENLLSVPKKNAQSSVLISSLIDDQKTTIVGTLISNNKFQKSKTYIISKSSMVGQQGKVLLGATEHDARVVARDEENDLVLLELAMVTSLNKINISTNQDTLAIKFDNLGDLLVSETGKDKQAVGVLSTTYITVPRNIGYFGANARFIDQKITITDITKGGSADGILLLKDIVTGVNGNPISQPHEYGEQVSKYFVGDTITVEIVRDGKAMQVQMHYLPYPMNHIADRFDGGKSKRSDGYKKVLVHDAAVRADECGSPVFNSHGQFYGINIARVSRTSTIMLSYDVIAKFLEHAASISKSI